MSVIRETLEQQRRVLDSFQLLGRGQSSSARRRYHEAAAKRNAELYNSTKHALAPQTIDNYFYENQTRAVSYPQAHYHSRNDHAEYDPQDIGDFLDDPATQLSPTDPNGVRGLLIQDSLALVEKRIRDFKEMNDRASDLEIWVREDSPIPVSVIFGQSVISAGGLQNIQKIDSNKDRQEAAIFAFTIVTVVFLPLSTVAGILDLNASDIRNLKTG